MNKSNFNNKKRQPRRNATQRIKGRPPTEDRSPSVSIGRQDAWNSTIGIPNMPVFSSAIRKRLNYFSYGSLTTTAGAMTNYVFSANGLYDPDYTGAGHQPIGFDQIMIFFDHYVVVKSGITVTFSNTSNVTAPLVAISLNSNNTALTDFTQLCETGFVTRDVLGFTTGSGSVKTLSIDCDIAKFQGVPTPRDNPDLWGTIAANPTEQSYYDLSVFDPAAGTAQVSWTAQMYFDAWFIEPRKISTSMQQTLHRLLVKQEEETRRNCPTHPPIEKKCK